jgi:hypothetical protein
MTLLPTVREQMQQAAAARARPRRRLGASARALVPVPALAAVIGLALLLGGWSTGGRGSAPLGYAPPISAASVFTAATPQRLREATDLELSSPLVLAALAQPDAAASQIAR